MSLYTCFKGVRIPILNENAKIGIHNRSECTHIASLMNINHRNCKISLKNKIVMLNIDNDYDILKQIYYFVTGEIPESLKDTRWLSVKIMKRLENNNREKDDVAIYSNLLQSI